MKSIKLRGVRTHNLKNVDIDIPRNKFTVITGLSGSGKSSLAFDTIYAEGQRRYVESLSSYARQFLSMMEKPDVDHLQFAFYDSENIPTDEWNTWLSSWWKRVGGKPNHAVMKKANPKYV